MQLLVKSGRALLRKVGTDVNIADLGTKVLSADRMAFLMKLMNAFIRA